jgi:actin-like ATPase involved in cell morphogenesis
MVDSLGIDLGTTYTAAAVVRDGRAEIVNLGVRAAAIPSLVFLREDESLIIGEAAERRGAGVPSRLAREFKRRVGDTTPIVVGSSPYSAERLSALLLRAVLDVVVEREGSLPDRIAVALPANWGEYKVGLMRQALSLAGVRDAALVSEPVAAAVHYASTERIETGSVVAVYDLGGGTFDAAVLRRTSTTFEVMGSPEGIERLGGIDFDDAILQHVRRALESRVAELDADDAGAAAARVRLRAECTAAKEALSSDTDTVIHVALASGAVDVRLTRSEFEAMIRPPLRETIDALRRAIDGAGVQVEDLRAVLLVGGSSRIPLVAEMLSADLGRPVAVDAHPKHAVAMGAARMALGSVPVGAAAPVVGEDDAAPALVALDAREADAAPTTKPGRRRWIPIVGAVAAAAIGVAAFVVLGGDDDEPAGSSSTTKGATTSSTGSATTESTEAPVEPCTASTARCAFIEAITIEGDHYRVEYRTDGFQPLMKESGGTDADHHVHFFLDTFSVDQVGTNSPAETRGQWTVWDLPKASGAFVFDTAKVSDRGDAAQLCVGVADAGHGIDTGGSDCAALPG